MVICCKISIHTIDVYYLIASNIRPVNLLGQFIRSAHMGPDKSIGRITLLKEIIYNTYLHKI